MDKLTDDERILAWKASWHPSFDGIAIVDQDFTFRSVNPQFCKLLGVSPADLIGQRFQDVTHPDVRKVDEENAKLLMAGHIDFYVLSKRYLFQNNHQVAVVLLVTRVPQSGAVEFKFFLSRIMLDENGALFTTPKKTQNCVPCDQTPIQKAADFFLKYHKALIATGSIIGAILVYLINHFGGNG